MMKLLLVVVGCVLLVPDTAGVTHEEKGIQQKNVQDLVSRRIPVGTWNLAELDLTALDAGILPDYWESHAATLLQIDPRVPINGAEPPEQLVKVTDRKHKFPVFATICSISFLATVVTLLIICMS